jgi:hypothetical protein
MMAQPMPTAFAAAQPCQPRLLDRVRQACRPRHYSIRTETAYVDWIKRFIVFHGKRHSLEMGAAEINAFLSHLAVAGRVSASTQNQAFSALLFLYRSVLEFDPGLDDLHPCIEPGRTRGAQSVGRAGLRQAMEAGDYSVRLWLRQAIAATEVL